MPPTRSTDRFDARHRRRRAIVPAAHLGGPATRAATSQPTQDRRGADIRDRSELVVPAGDAAMSDVDARDVGAVAARCLLDDFHIGRSYAPTGPAAITHADIAAALTRELRRLIRYTRPSLPRYWLHARRTDMSAGTVAVTSVLYTLARLGVGSRVTDDVSTVLGRAATTFARFAHDHRAAWC
jgi:uncharacterized protein YbjT (DUF2867 family)